MIFKNWTKDPSREWEHRLWCEASSKKKILSHDICIKEKQ